MNSRIVALGQLVVAVAIASCTGADTRSVPSVLARSDSAPWYLDTTEACGFVKAVRSTQPTDLVREYVRRDGAGEFLTADPWLDSALVCAGHLPGWDMSTIITDAAVALIDSTPSAVRVRVTYTKVGFHGPDVHIEPSTLEVDTFVVVPTPWGWRIDGPQLDQHVLPLATMRLLRLRGADSIALEALVGPSASISTDPTPTLVLPGMDYREVSAIGSWLGLYQGPDGRWSLRPAQIGRGITHDGCREADVPVFTVSPAGASFLVSGSEGLREASGPTLARSPIYVGPGDSVVIPIRGTPRRIEVRGFGKETVVPNGRLVKDYVLNIIHSDDDHGYGLVAWTGDYSEVAPSVEWLGDLNQDGTPDALIKVPTAAGGTMLRLIVSDYSGEEEVYRTLGQVEIPDC